MPEADARVNFAMRYLVYARVKSWCAGALANADRGRTPNHCSRGRRARPASFPERESEKNISGEGAETSTPERMRSQSSKKESAERISPLGAVL
jgi:hypothetical protein